MDFLKLDQLLFDTRKRMKLPEQSSPAFDLIVDDFNKVCEMSWIVSGTYERETNETNRR